MLTFSEWWVVKKLNPRTINVKLENEEIQTTNGRAGDPVNLDLNIEKQIAISGSQSSEADSLVEQGLPVVREREKNTFVLENDRNENQANFAGDEASKVCKKNSKLSNEQQR